VTPDQIRQDERYTVAAEAAKRWARAAIRCLDEGLPRSATMELETALGMAQQAVWVWQELEKETPTSGTK
jgi:transposase-like protein